MTPDSEHLEPERRWSSKDVVVHGRDWFIRSSAVDAALTSLEAERDEARAGQAAIADTVLEALDDWRDGLGTPAQFVRHRLGGSATVYAVEGFKEVLARAEAAETRLEAVREWAEDIETEGIDAHPALSVRAQCAREVLSILYPEWGVNLPERIGPDDTIVGPG